MDGTTHAEIEMATGTHSTDVDAVNSAIQGCQGYQKLLAAVEENELKDGARPFHDYRAKLQWIVERAQHYAEKTGLDAADILDAWEADRRYWYMNYYQEANQPAIKSDSVRVFDTVEDMLLSVGRTGFRCPNCKGVSRSPYRCDSGVQVELINSNGKKQACNWSVGGLFGHMGQGVFIFVKTELKGENMFKPIAWEQAEIPTESEAANGNASSK